MTATGWDPARRKSWGSPEGVGKHKFVKLGTFSQTVRRMQFAIRGRALRIANDRGPHSGEAGDLGEFGEFEAKSVKPG